MDQNLFIDFLDSAPSPMAYHKLHLSSDGQLLDLDVLYANSAYETIFHMGDMEYPVERAIGFYQDFFHGDFQWQEKFHEIGKSTGEYQEEVFLRGSKKVWSLLLFSRKPGFLGIKIEEVSKKSSIKSKKLWKGTPMGILEDRVNQNYWHWDSVEDNFYISTDWMEHMGYQAMEESIGRKEFLENIHILDRPFIESHLDMLQSGKPVKEPIEFRMLTLGKELRWVKSRAEFIQDMLGNALGVTGTLEDITDRKETASRLKVSEENFRSFFDTMNDMVFIGGPSGKIILTNPSVTKSLGFTPQEIKGKYFMDLFPENRRKEAEFILQQIFQGHREVCPLPLVGKHGHIIKAESRIWLGIWDGMDCIFGISRDVSLQWEAQQRFEKLFQNSPALQILLNLNDNTVSHINNTFLRTLEYSEYEIIGRPIADLEFIDKEKKINNLIHLFSHEKSIPSIEVRLKRKNGGILHGLFSGEVIKGSDNDSFLAVIVDISQQKEIEEELQRERKQLKLTLDETTRMNKVMMGRESRVVEMKKEVNQLLQELHRSPRYKSVLSVDKQ